MRPPTIVDMLRHGEPVGGRRYRGQVDDLLSDRGWRQMWSAVEDPAPWSQIVSSPLARCRAFALDLGKKLAIPVAQDNRLREVGFGEWEGKTAAQLKKRDPHIISRFYKDPVNNRPKDAEPLSDFSRRVSEAFDEALSTHPGQHILIVAHAGVIRAVIAKVLNAPLEAMYCISVDNAALIRVKTDHERPPTLVLPRRSAPDPQ